MKILGLLAVVILSISSVHAGKISSASPEEATDGDNVFVLPKNYPRDFGVVGVYELLDRQASTIRVDGLDYYLSSNVKVVVPNISASGLLSLTKGRVLGLVLKGRTVTNIYQFPSDFKYMEH